VVLWYQVQSNVEQSLVEYLLGVGIAMVPIENMYNSMANITSFFSLDIPEWKS